MWILAGLPRVSRSSAGSAVGEVVDQAEDTQDSGGGRRARGPRGPTKGWEKGGREKVGEAGSGVGEMMRGGSRQ